MIQREAHAKAIVDALYDGFSFLVMAGFIGVLNLWFGVFF